MVSHIKFEISGGSHPQGIKIKEIKKTVFDVVLQLFYTTPNYGDRSLSPLHPHSSHSLLWWHTTFFNTTFWLLVANSTLVFSTSLSLQRSEHHVQKSVSPFLYNTTSARRTCSILNNCRHDLLVLLKLYVILQYSNIIVFHFLRIRPNSLLEKNDFVNYNFILGVFLVPKLTDTSALTNMS